MSPTDESLTLPLARQVFLTSFWLSQGSLPFQEWLFRYVATLRSLWRLYEEQRLALVAPLAPVVHTMEARGCHTAFPHRGNGIAAELDDSSKLLQEIMSSGRHDDRVELLYQVIAGFIERDERFLCEGLRERRLHAAASNTSPHSDPHLSFFAHYVLLGKSCGCLVFDEMLREMGKSMQSQDRVFLRVVGDPLIVKSLKQVLAAHNQWHPQSLVSVPFLAR